MTWLDISISTKKQTSLALRLENVDDLSVVLQNSPVQSWFPPLQTQSMVMMWVGMTSLAACQPLSRDVIMSRSWLNSHGVSWDRRYVRCTIYGYMPWPATRPLHPTRTCHTLTMTDIPTRSPQLLLLYGITWEGVAAVDRGLHTMPSQATPACMWHDSHVGN